MRESVDCAVLMLPAHEAWMRSLIQAQRAELPGVVLHPVDLAEPGYGGPGCVSAASLREGALALRRFDVCLVPVTPLTLGWTRLALANAVGVLATPLLGVARDLRAAGLQDLLNLGMRDFVRDPIASDDLRIRIRQCVLPRPSLRVAEPGASTVPEALAEPAGEPGEPPPPRLDPAEPFRLAKARMVTDFERRYLKALLRRHHGNISQAARAADKNRRAFWQLMRKHQIAAEPYRSRRA